MAAFSAINVEPEENVNEEVDTTKEIQVEDALKLFQNALKLHAQGPRFFDQAADAYDTLFRSEIFKYPESKTDYERAEAGQDSVLAAESAFAQDLLGLSADVDGLASSLPQALYLSYKNHGQFVIDRIRYTARSTSTTKKALSDDAAVRTEAQIALDNFSAALDRDPSDAELWRKAARVASFLKSARISRYSLEAAIELDDDPAVDEVDPPSLAEGFAGIQLRQQLEVLDDEMALSHPIMKPFLNKEVPPHLSRYVDPMPFLPDPTKTLAVPGALPSEITSPRLVLSVSGLSWTELGIAIAQITAEEGLPGQAVSIQLPDAREHDDVQMEIDLQLHPPGPSPAPEKPVDSESAGEAAVTEQPREGTALVEEPNSATTDPAPANEPSKDRSNSIPSRKRSQSAAGIPEGHDDEAADLKRSKRTRRRDTAPEEAMDSATFLATQLQPLQAADQNLFQTTKNLLENLGVTDSVTLGRVAEVLDSCASDDRTGKIQHQAALDLAYSITHFEEDLGAILLSKRELPKLSLSAFLEHAKSGSQRALEPPAFEDSRGVKAFAGDINQGWSTMHDVAYEYVRAMARSYKDRKWSDQLKAAVIGVVGQLEGSIYERFTHELAICKLGEQRQALLELAELAQMLFELHLDNYDRIMDPSTSTADKGMLLETRARLDRWMGLSIEIIRLRDPQADDDLLLRFLWAAVVSATVTKGTPRDHVLNCWHSLRDHLAASARAEIGLPNSTAMPDISTAAAEREISKLTTMDFFLGLFQEEKGDPLSVIESLEPVLNPEGVSISLPAAAEATGADGDAAGRDRLPITECASQQLVDLWKFLKSSNTELRLLLWSRLGEAYGRIQYVTKQFSCFLRSIETIVAEFERDDYNQTPDEPRRSQFMSLLKALDDLVIQSLHLALNDNSSFDIIDEDHLRSTMSALAKISCMLHVAAIYEDETRVGMRPVPPANAPLRPFLNKLQEMQVRTWSLQYTMLKVGINQQPDIFPKPQNDLADYLAAVHQVLGLRKCCKSSNKIFLKMMRVELLKQKNIENWEDYLGQVLYDLHGLKLGVGIWEVQDHGCEPENLEKRQALLLVEKVTMLANRMSMKDLLKSDLKTTIERMQQAIGSAKSSPQMAHNLRNYSEYLKSPIHPLHLYQALSGSVHLDAVTINTPESAPAKQGWFFLLGMIALTKFKGVDLNRRQTPGATDDLRIGATFLRLQLQYTPDRWDAWFRLAECFDYELDESVLWTADKMNKERAELVRFQRNAIHSYIMALSHSFAWASEPSVLTSLEDDEEALYDMYHEFGMRMYSSSREPFAMEPFHHADQKRFFIEAEGPGTYKKILHNEMTDYQVWKFAAHLFRKAMAGKPKDWKNPYMVAKCLWKMYQKLPEELDERNRLHRPTVQAVVDALEKTIEVVSSLPKPRHGQEPILEPHYKILSVVNKLVMRGDLLFQEGAAILQRQPYAPDRGKEDIIDNVGDWDAYVIRCLRYLRDKDKSNWQHRIIMRHARVVFDEGADPSDGGSYVAAKAAFSVLRESMFTKTMVMNVWKCDAERPGRHHVYTERYIRYVVKLLDVMNDRVSLEAVLRRIRKKGADFYHFNELWQFCVQVYVKLLRQTFKIAVTGEDAFKTIGPEEFDLVGERITEWATTGAAEESSALTAMKEAVELKKLNANLMKAGPIDDLITDCYAAIYLHVKPDVPGAEQQQSSQQPADDSSPSEPKSDEPAAAAAAGGESKTNLFHGLSAREGDQPPSSSATPSLLGPLRASSEQPDRGGDRSEKHSVAGDAAAAVPRRVHGGIRRPNILRKAEQAVQAVQRAAEASSAAPRSAGGGASGSGASTGGGSGGGAGKSRIGSISSSRGARATRGAEEEESGSEEDVEDVEMRDADTGAGGEGIVGARRAQVNRRRQEEEEEEEEEEGSEISSPPGSVHDSADDESDLSDVPVDYEDDVPPSLLFPNLRRSVDHGAGKTADEESTDEESSADEEPGGQGGERDPDQSGAGNGGGVKGKDDINGDDTNEELDEEEEKEVAQSGDGGAETGGLVSPKDPRAPEHGDRTEDGDTDEAEE